MSRLFLKEIGAFFNNLTGIVVVATFLIILSLFLWVFPGAYNIGDSSYASLDGLFELAPYVFLFLIPAITMRLFADEKKAGTMELMLTKPLTDLQIVLAKYFAGLTLLLVSLLPTLVFFYTVWWYALPPGMDTGGTWGSYIGLLFLGSSFVAIGMFASSLTDNQIISFILALFLCGFAFIGFELASGLGLFGQWDLLVRNLGIQTHYTSMSRGVIDTRDLLYFFGFSALFVLLTKIRLESRHWLGDFSFRGLAGKQGTRSRHFYELFAGILLIAGLNVAGSYHFARLDLTSERRHTLTPATKHMLSELDDIVFFRVYLEGNLPAGFRRLRSQCREMLEEFQAYSDMVQVEFVNPLQPGDQGRQYVETLIGKGLQPTQVQVRGDDATSQQLIFPAALVAYKDKEVPVQLLHDQMGLPAEEVLNNSAQAMEYHLATAIRRLTEGPREKLGFIASHGTFESRYVADITQALSEFYTVDRVLLEGGFEAIENHRTLVIARPNEAFSEGDKYILDQFLMRGGSLLWLVDPVYADMDSLQAPSFEAVALPRDLNIDDMFFKYGVRLNADLVQDLQAAPLAVTTGEMAGRPQINLLPWYFFPLASPAVSHPVVNNLNLLRTEFVSSLDTIASPGIEKTILLETSPYSRTLPSPVLISLDILQDPPDERLYAGPPKPIGALLEGRFQSVFTNRILPEVGLPPGFIHRDESAPTAMIVVSDGDIIRNQFGSGGQALPLGYDRFSGETFGNKDFVLNAINYLSDDSGFMEARARVVRLRLLDRTRVVNDLKVIRLVNVLLPLLLVIVAGLARMFWRKNKYTA